MAVDISCPRRILIVKLSSIGDVVMTTPVAKALRGAYPEAYIAWVVESKSKDILLGNPYLDEVIVWDRPNNGSKNPLKKVVDFLLSLRRLSKHLRTRNFDVAIDLQGLLRSALVARMSGARCVLGYDNARECAPRLYDMVFKAGERKVRGPQNYLDMLSLLGIHSTDLDMHVPIDESDREYARSFLEREVSNTEKSAIVALCPATTWPQKHWMEEGWAQLADRLTVEYGAVPVFLGSKVDIPLVERICSKCSSAKPVSAVGKTTLKQAAAIIEQSNLVISVDTGLLHIALALEKPSVGIFGPTGWAHLTKKDIFRVVAKEFPCTPCLRHPVCSEFDCMKAITADDVLEAARSWLLEAGNGRSTVKNLSSSTLCSPESESPARSQDVSQSCTLKTLHVETGMHSLGGPAQVVYLMTGLKERGHTAVLVCPTGSSVARHARSAGLEVITVPLFTDLDFTFVLRLWKIIKRVKPDIVHLHSRRGADIMGGLAARLAHVPIVILSRRIDNPIRRGLISSLKYGRLCDHIIAVSNGVVSALVKGGVNPQKITCVHSVIDAKRYQKKGSEDKVRAEFGIDENTNVVSIISQLIERKGHRFLFQAAPRILERFPNTVFLVLGEGKLEGSLRKLVASLGIQDKVIFAGFRNDIGELLSITTVLVHPATMEGFANCVLQAMAAEVPVVVTAVGGMPEAVRDNVNGILIPPRDPDAIADAVIKLLGDPGLRQRMGAEGRRIAEQQFSVDTMVEGVLAVYFEVLRARKEAVAASLS
jgi:lipopolysaccharide heptosyltransferase I